MPSIQCCILHNVISYFKSLFKAHSSNNSAKLENFMGCKSVSVHLYGHTWTFFHLNVFFKENLKDKRFGWKLGPTIFANFVWSQFAQWNKNGLDQSANEDLLSYKDIFHRYFGKQDQLYIFQNNNNSISSNGAFKSPATDDHHQLSNNNILESNQTLKIQTESHSTFPDAVPNIPLIYVFNIPSAMGVLRRMLRSYSRCPRFIPCISNLNHIALVPAS